MEGERLQVVNVYFLFSFYLNIAFSNTFWLWRSKRLALSLFLHDDLYHDTSACISSKDVFVMSKGQLQILDFADVCIRSACINDVFES